MKYFDTLTEGVKEALTARGADLGKLLYCLKCDMDGEGLYYDTYLAFDSESLYIVSGYDRLSREKKKYVTAFDFRDYKEYSLKDLTELYVDRYRHTCRLMGKFGDEDSGEKICIGRFSSGFSEKAEQFCRRYKMTVKHEEIDDTPLAENSPYCPKCGQKYPDPNRKFCPYCVKKSSIFKRLMGLFGQYRVRVALIVLMMILSAALAVLSPYFSTTFLYDNVLNAAGEFYGKIIFAVAAVAGIKLLSMLLQTAYGIFFTKSLTKVMHSLRVKVYNSMQHLSLPFFTSKQTGSLMSRVAATPRTSASFSPTYSPAVL